jgi:uncharacterized membrane protein YccF (DUF307 family)
MTLILNILWLVLGGLVSGLLWVLGGLVLAITIVGFPWAIAAWRIAGFVLWPFGKEIVDRSGYTGRPDGGEGVNLVLNIIWILFGGWYIALTHLLLAIGQAITIIGLPFAFKNLQLAGLSLMPVGRAVVDTD